MNHALRRPMTADEFLAWEVKQELKWEFDGFQPVAMTGGTNTHATMQVNLITALRNRLRGKPCRPYGSDLKVGTGHGYRYPDAFVTCTPVAPDATAVVEPVVIFEVLSRSTRQADRTVKLAEYQSIRSVRRYVMLEQYQALATVIERKGEDWTVRLLRPDAVLAMPEIGIEVPLAELYADVAFAPDPDAEDDGR